ncbi:hypothetical protein J4E81_005715 [Alternaria sp. BMP 2799]|nr:hypothetical protein J4E81_005715 [Alternaria sp. BMP 2799]
MKEMVEQLKEECHHRDSAAQYWRYRYDQAVDTAIRPYMESKGLAFDEFTEVTISTVKKFILDDAHQTDDLHNEIHRLDLQVQDIGDELVASGIQCLSLEEQITAQQAELQNMVQNLEISQGETQQFQVQVQALQKEMLANVSKVQAISDETFSRDFYALASAIKSLSRSVAPAKSVDIQKILKPCEFLVGVGKHHWSTRARKKAYVEAWIWCALVSSVFLNPFTFGGENTANLNDDWNSLFGKGYNDEWPDPSPDSEAWRYYTVKSLVAQIGRGLIAEGQIGGKNWHADEKIEDLQESVLKMRADAVKIIRGNLRAVSRTADLAQVAGIINQALTLAMSMSLQRCRLQITYPARGEKFDAESMSQVPDRNGDDVHGGVVAFVVNPGLTKRGDANGNHLDKWYEIVPSLVQLE